MPLLLFSMTAHKKASTRESVRRDNSINYSGGYSAQWQNQDSSIGGSSSRNFGVPEDDKSEPLQMSSGGDPNNSSQPSNGSKKGGKHFRGLSSDSAISESIAEETSGDLQKELAVENMLYDEQGNRKAPRSSNNESAAAMAVQATDESLRNEYELMKQRLWKQQQPQQATDPSEGETKTAASATEDRAPAGDQEEPKGNETSNGNNGEAGVGETKTAATATEDNARAGDQEQQKVNETSNGNNGEAEQAPSPEIPS
jgi:hypothetical protein